MTAKLNASESDLGPLLTDVAGFSRLEGVGNLAIDLAASGASQIDIVRSLSGLVDAQVTSGSIAGVDVTRLLTGFREKALDAVLLGAGGETSFDFLEATFAIDKGVARNDNLTVQAAAFQISGNGTVDIVNRKLDYRMRAALLGPAVDSDDGAVTKLFEVPLIVKGPWSAPRAIPDAAQIIQETIPVDRAVREVGEALQQGDLEAARAAAENALKDSKSGVRSLLDGILGQPDSQQNPQ